MVKKLLIAALILFLIGISGANILIPPIVDARLNKVRSHSFHPAVCGSDANSIARAIAAMACACSKENFPENNIPPQQINTERKEPLW